ncbi:MAG: FmdB family zinc ribbon protein [Desulfocucumaceae bacterium]
MPIYEFRCLECGNVFEKLFVKPDEKAEISCPKCQSESFERIISSSNYVMGAGKSGKRPSVTTKSCGSESGCTTLEIPGPDD